MEELSVVGKSLTKVDAMDKAMGRTKYTADFDASVLHVKIIRSPHAHAKIISIDTSKVEAYPGVRGVVLPDDVPKKRTGYIVCVDKYILPVDGIVRYIGEPVGAVIADSEEIAEEAMQFLDIKYETMPAVFDAEESFKKDCPVVIHPNKKEYGQPGVYLMGSSMEREIPNACTVLKIHRGDTEKAFKEADLIVENRYTFDGGSQARPELFVMDAWIEGDVYTVRAARTRMWGCHGWLCNLFNLPPSKVRLITPFTGGAFGGKGTIVAEAICLIAAKKTGRKVRLSLTREEEFIDTNPRPRLVIYMKDAVKKDGTILARQALTIADIGAYGAAGGTITGFTSQQGIISLYKIPNWHLDSYTVYTNNPTTGTMRGVESPQVAWAAESNMDLIAAKLGMTPLEIRLKNVAQDGDTTALGQVLSNVNPRGCIEKAAEMIEMNKPAVSDGKWMRGKGIALCSYGPGPWWPASSIAKIYRDGTLEIRIGTDESGQGLIQTMTQIAAEEFHTTVDKIQVVRGDTATVPWDWGSVASRSTWMTGNAVILAVKEAKKKLFEAAAKSLKAKPEELEHKNGKVFIKASPEKSIDIGSLFKYDVALGQGEIVGTSAYVADHTEIGPVDGHSPKAFPAYSYLAYGIQLAVNKESGEIKIEKVAAAADIGQPINMKMVEAQLEGSIGQGIGCAVYEKFDRVNGMLMNCSFVGYKMPTAPEVPGTSNIQITSVGHPEPGGPFGGKALGEMGLIPFSACIGNAFANATGVRLKDAPLTRERVYMGLKAAGKGAK